MEDEMPPRSRSDFACSLCIALCFVVALVFITSSVLHFELFVKMLIVALVVVLGWNLLIIWYYCLNLYRTCKEVNVKEIEMTVIKSGETCSICLEPCGHGVELVCKHVFHAECIGKWLDTNPSCPNCRLEV